MRRKERHYKGFTLVELLVVLLITGILLSTAAFQYSSSINTSKHQAFQSAVLNALSAAESYRQKYGEYPSTASLNTLFNDTSYFTTKPLNPYTGQPLTATTSTDSSVSNQKGYFYYNVVNGTPQIVTNPAMNLNLASGTSTGSITSTYYSVTFTVQDSGSTKINGASIMIGGQTVTTNSSGQAVVSLLPGLYFYAVSKDGYNFYTGNINVSGNTSQTVVLTNKTYTVTIFVMDANTGQPVSGASVSGVGSGGTTDPNGKLTLSNVPAGSYTANISASGYNSVSKAITVNNNQQVNITLVKGSCTITFNITNGQGALVQLSDGSSFTLESGGGSVSKPCGEYSYTISKEGYNALSGSIKALSNVTVKGVMASTGGSLMIGGGNIVEIAVVFSPLAASFKDLYKDNPNRGIVVYSVTSGTYQLSLLDLAKTVYDYAVAFRPVAMQVVAIGAGGSSSYGSTIIGGGSGYFSWANVAPLPDVNATLTVNVNVGDTLYWGDGQPTTVSIPRYLPTLTANGGQRAIGYLDAQGGNSARASRFGTGFAASRVGNGTSWAYVYPQALSIWKELATSTVAGNGIGGGGGLDQYGALNQEKAGAVFVLIRGVVYY